MKRTYFLTCLLYTVMFAFTILKTNFYVSAETLISLSSEPIVIGGGGDFSISGGSEDSPGAPIAISEVVDYKLTFSSVYIDGDITGGAGIYIPSGATVNIELEGENIIKGADGFAGISVENGATLTITGEGTLYVYGGISGAGIGGTNDKPGTINIESGTVFAYGGENAAGIGGNNASPSNAINISGGKVTAYGGNGGPGIGGGYGCHGGTVNITGGTVKAVGGENAYDIGSGVGYAKSLGTVNISNASVFAKTIFSPSTDTSLIMYTLELPFTNCSITNLCFGETENSKLNDVFTDENGYIYWWKDVDISGSNVSTIVEGSEYSGDISSEYFACLLSDIRSNEDVINDIINVKKNILKISEENTEVYDALDIIELKQEALEIENQ